MALASPRTSAHIPASTRSPAEQQEIQRLYTALEQIHGLADEGRSHICAMAQLAMSYLDHLPDSAERRTLKGALHALWGEAGNSYDTITYEAESLLDSTGRLYKEVCHD